METRTYTERSNARRAARAAGLDPDTHVKPCEDGFEVRFLPLMEKVNEAMDRVELNPDHPLKQAVDAAVARGIPPKEFVQIAEEAADQLADGIPQFLKISPEQRKAAWDRNPPKTSAAKPKETITMASKSKAKADKKAKANGSDNNATLMKMLSGNGSSVEEMTKALDWLPHTLRARISRLNKPKSKGGEGMTVERSRADGVTTYRIA